MTENETTSGAGQANAQAQPDAASTGQQVQSGAGDRGTGQGSPGITDYLSRPDVKYEIKYVVGIFAVVGLGFGLTGFVFNDVLIGGATESGGEGENLIAGMLTILSIVGILTVATMSGTIISVFTSREIRSKFDDLKPAYVAAGAGNGVGCVVMMIVTAVILSFTISTESSGGGAGAGGGGTEGGVSLLSLGDLIVPIIALAIPVVVVSLATVYLEQRLRYTPEGGAATAD